MNDQLEETKKYNIYLTRKGDNFIFESPDFSIIVKNKSIAIAENEIREAIARRLFEYADADLTPPPPKYESKLYLEQSRSILTRRKLGIIVSIFAVLSIGVIFIGGNIVRTAENAIWSAAANVKTAIQPRAVHQAFKSALQSLEEAPPERRQEILDDVNNFAIEIEPFVQPLRSIIFGPKDDKHQL